MQWLLKFVFALLKDYLLYFSLSHPNKYLLNFALQLTLHNHYHSTTTTTIQLRLCGSEIYEGLFELLRKFSGTF